MALTLDKQAPEDMDITVFSPRDDFVVAKALEVTREAKEKRQFTDMANFTLRCVVCQLGLVGEKEAVAHAQSTGILVALDSF